MRLLLRGFSQDVDFENMEAAISFLVFENEDTKEVVRLPVPESVIAALAELLRGEVSDEKPEPNEDQEDEEEEEKVPEPEHVYRAPRKESDVTPL